MTCVGLIEEIRIGVHVSHFRHKHDNGRVLVI